MGFFANYHKRRLQLTGRESVATLAHMHDYFQDGANWTQSMYANEGGARCLVGAANHVRVSPIDDAKHWLRLAIAEIAPGVARIEDFNDGCRTYAEVAAVIERATELATQSTARLALPAPRPQPAFPVAEILPPRAARAPARVFLNPPPRRTRRSLVDWIMD